MACEAASWEEGLYVPILEEQKREAEQVCSLTGISGNKSQAVTRLPLVGNKPDKAIFLTR